MCKTDTELLHVLGYIQYYIAEFYMVEPVES